jgi:hypothetical protein
MMPLEVVTFEPHIVDSKRLESMAGAQYQRCPWSGIGRVLKAGWRRSTSTQTIAAVSGKPARKRNGPLVLPVASLNQPTTDGPMNPPTLNTVFTRAIPAAAAGPRSSRGGRHKNGGTKLLTPISTSAMAATRPSGLGRSAAPRHPTVATKVVETNCVGSFACVLLRATGFYFQPCSFIRLRSHVSSARATARCPAEAA